MTFAIVVNIVLAISVFIIVVGLMASSMVPSRRSRRFAPVTASRRLAQSRRSPAHERAFQGERSFQVD